MSSTLVIALYNTVLLPDVEYRLNIDGLSDEEKARAREDGGKAVLLPMKQEVERENMKESDFYPIGVYADVMEVTEGPAGIILHAQTKEKAKVTSLDLTGDVITCEWEPVDEVVDITYEGEKKLLENLRTVTTEVASQIRGGGYAIEYLKSIKSVNEYAAVFCQFFDMTPEEKYALLATNSYKERGLLVHEALMRFKGTIDMQVDLANADDPEGISYKKAAIHKQIALLEKQLEEIEPDKTQDENSFEKRIERAGMPDNIRKEVERVLRRFNQEPSNGPEYNSLYDYLDFVTSLKWQPDPTEKIDLKKARRIMDRDHYGLDKVKERILQHLAVMALNEEKSEKEGQKGSAKGTILLLVGAPGTGKTSMGKSVAEALGRKYVRISLGGIRDEAEIRGHRRTYIGAMAGRIMTGIKRCGSMNPVMVLDEVDKIKASFDGDPSAALLEVLDPEQNTTFEDHYVDLPYDLSHVFFICTANTWDTIPQPLLDRMEIIELPGYTPTEHFHIAKEHLVPQALEETGLTRKDIRFTDGALRKIIEDYTMEAGVRGLKKQLLTVCRKAAVMLVEGEETPAALPEKKNAVPAQVDAAAENGAVSAEEAAENGSANTVPGETNTEAGGEDTKDKNGKDSKEAKVPVVRPIVVREKNIETFLGRKKVFHDRVLKNNPPGVVTGLAWTQAGGEILFIESVAMKGTGQIRLTGQIGDVMKESAETAVSLVKSTFIDEDLNFAERDIHIHIPEGAVPKDGPSAGITMFTGGHIACHRHSGQPVSGDDRRDFPARGRASDRRTSGEADGGDARGHQEGPHSEGQCP
jgi:ATP-dependent Lon protease